MKRIYRNFALLFITLSVHGGFAQGCINLNGVAPLSFIARKPGGIWMGLLSESVFSKQEKPTIRPELRFGFGMYLSELNNKTLEQVPLLPPGTGGSRVSVENTLCGFSGQARLSLPYSFKVVPYVDVYLGGVRFASDLYVKPYDISQKDGHQKLGSYYNLNAGAGAGLLIDLGKGCKLDLSMVYSGIVSPGLIADPGSARVESGYVVLDRVAIPSKLFMAKVGVVLCFDNEGSGTATGGSGYGTHHRSRWSSGHRSCSGSRVGVLIH